MTAATVIAAALPAVAHADNTSQLTVVGTSDVSDSGLIPNLIQPEFENAYPQFTFKYVGSATGAAINSAEGSGKTSGASALIVHAPSLENSFVGSGFSYNNQPGNAIFTNDFVLAGPATGESSSANVLSNANHNVAQAFADIAAAGASGHATFISRGGDTSAPGTVVEEHKLWALMASANLTPAGVDLCNVSAADGGGMSPVNTSLSLSGQPCPDNGTVETSASAPAWYVINSGVTQAANVIAGNACTLGTSGANTCYVLTDRGTFDYLTSGTNTAGPNQIPNLQIVTRDNSASAPGGQYELENYFHIYIINPSKPGEAVNVTAANDLVTFLTSPAFQSQLKNYLPDTGDIDGAPFKADASPTFNLTSGFPGTVAAGKTVAVTGTLTNAELGFPALANETVSVDEIEGGIPVAVGHAVTNTTGGFSVSFVPKTSGQYQLSTGTIVQLEEPSLTPPYSDTLSPGASAATQLNVQSSVSISNAKGTAGGATVSGTVGPAAPDGNARVAILARKGSSGRFSEVGAATLSAGQTTFGVNASLGAGKWQVQASYSDGAELVAGTSSSATVTVPSSSTAVKFGKIKAKRGSLTVSGSLSQSSTSSRARVELFALRTGGSPRFKQVGKATVKSGKSTFSIKVKLARNAGFILQLEFVEPGQPNSFSKLATVSVH